MFECDILFHLRQHGPRREDDTRLVEERRVEVCFVLHPFAACDHPEVTQAAQLDHIPFFQPFLHDGQDAVDDQFHIPHEGGAAHCHHVAELFEFQLFQGTDLCIVQLRALGCVFAHIRSSYQAIV